jgi:hypothetical protein
MEELIYLEIRALESSSEHGNDSSCSIRGRGIS